jgi:hypothetical protein
MVIRKFSGRWMIHRLELTWKPETKWDICGKKVSSRGQIPNELNKRLYRTPDAFPNPANELQRLAPSYQKLIGSRAIDPYLDPDNTRSDSFSYVNYGKNVLFRRCCWLVRGIHTDPIDHSVAFHGNLI